MFQPESICTDASQEKQTSETSTPVPSSTQAFDSWSSFCPFNLYLVFISIVYPTITAYRPVSTLWFFWFYFRQPVSLHFQVYLTPSMNSTGADLRNDEHGKEVSMKEEILLQMNFTAYLTKAAVLSNCEHLQFPHGKY